MSRRRCFLHSHVPVSPGCFVSPGMPELTMTMADGRDVHVVYVVAGAVQSADPLGFESALEPGPTFSRSDLGGE